MKLHLHSLFSDEVCKNRPQKVAKLSEAKFSRFEGTRGDKNQIFRNLVLIGCLFNLDYKDMIEEIF